MNPQIANSRNILRHYLGMPELDRGNIWCLVLYFDSHGSNLHMTLLNTTYLGTILSVTQCLEHPTES